MNEEKAKAYYVQQLRPGGTFLKVSPTQRGFYSQSSLPSVFLNKLESMYGIANQRASKHAWFSLGLVQDFLRNTKCKGTSYDAEREKIFSHNLGRKNSVFSVHTEPGISNWNNLRAVDNQHSH